MKTKYFIFAASALVALASCSNDEYVGDNNGLTAEQGDGSIQFSYTMPNATRADIYGPEAATKLGNFFYVMGTKGTEATTYPTKDLVFDNYLVQYTANTAGTTASNTANWEYVGINPGETSTPAEDFPKLSSITGAQTIKYWDYSVPQYDFFAFSTGNRQPVNSTTPGDITAATQVGVTKMKYGENLENGGPAYTFYIPSEEALKQIYVTDIVEVEKANYGKEVQLQFKNLGSKIRLALYETVPGYAVSEVKFYTSDKADTPKPNDLGASSTDATLISTATLPTNATVVVTFPHVGTKYKTGAEATTDYNKASVSVTGGTGTTTNHGFGTINYTAGENVLSSSNNYLGRTLTDASFAGTKADDYFTPVFPISSSNALTLCVDYKLTAIDGSNEVINVYGAKASIPANYTVWRPNYAYTYIFKISDNTNGWTSTAAGDPAGLFPITFDAVVAQAADANAEQTTVTTVATPSITTYQQGHKYSDQNEYSMSQKAGKDATNAKNIYVQVMNTSVSPSVAIGGLTAANSLVYKLSEDVTEAKVIDALTMRTTAIGEADITGRNGLVLDLPDASYINNAATTIVNGVDDNPIKGLTSGTVGEIDVTKLAANTSYAYVYVQAASTKEVDQYEPITPGATKINESAPTHKYYAITTTDIEGGSTLGAAENPNDGDNTNYVYFSKVVDGADNVTYYYISTLDKSSVPAGCIKVAKTEAEEKTGDDAKEANTFYFDKYISNNGKYAVKVIKIKA